MSLLFRIMLGAVCVSNNYEFWETMRMIMIDNLFNYVTQNCPWYRDQIGSWYICLDCYIIDARKLDHLEINFEKDKIFGKVVSH